MTHDISFFSGSFSPAGAGAMTCEKPHATLTWGILTLNVVPAPSLDLSDMTPPIAPAS